MAFSPYERRQTPPRQRPNPVLQIMQMAQNGSNPQDLAMGMLQQQAQTNPEAARVFQMLQGKSPQEFDQITRNLISNHPNPQVMDMYTAMRRQYNL